jgi:DNA-directed RNA polymerase subunit RPC12/RpoP
MARGMDGNGKLSIASNDERKTKVIATCASCEARYVTQIKTGKNYQCTFCGSERVTFEEHV